MSLFYPWILTKNNRKQLIVLIKGIIISIKLVSWDTSLWLYCGEWIWLAQGCIQGDPLELLWFTLGSNRLSQDTDNREVGYWDFRHKNQQDWMTDGVKEVWGIHICRMWPRIPACITWMQGVIVTKPRNAKGRPHLRGERS